MTPKCESLSDRLFLTHTGNEYVKISENIQQVANAYGNDQQQTEQKSVWNSGKREPNITGGRLVGIM